MIPRHRTALTRVGLSRPVRLAINDGILIQGKTFFDYGCGRGSDVALVSAQGIPSRGWDPIHAPETPKQEADIVNLGYVVNVIEDDRERRQALLEAWELTRAVLVVTARMTFEELGQALTPFGDGYLTSRGTFQRFYQHGELRDWIAATLGTEPVAAAPGVFYIFRNSTARESFLAGRQRRTGPSLRPSSAEVVFDQYRPLFDAVLPFFSARGRLPAVHELPVVGDLLKAVPRVDTLLRAIRNAIGAEVFDKRVEDRRHDLIVYLALAQFDGRPSLRRLPSDIQLDVRSLFPSYEVACATADQLLLKVGDRESREVAFRACSLGKLTGNALYVHVSAVQRLPTLLRLYEGCARAFVGVVDGATLVKLHRIKHQVSYLAYPRFDRDAHPALVGSLVVRLRDRAVDYRDYSTWSDPPVLHRKELFVGDDYPRRDLFAALTTREERVGLLADPAKIGTTSGWQRTLSAAGFEVRGHRLKRILGKTRLGDTDRTTAP